MVMELFTRLAPPTSKALSYHPQHHILLISQNKGTFKGYTWPTSILIKIINRNTSFDLIWFFLPLAKQSINIYIYEAVFMQNGFNSRTSLDVAYFNKMHYIEVFPKQWIDLRLDWIRLLIYMESFRKNSIDLYACILKESNVLYV